MMVLQHHLPLLDGLAVSVGLAQSTLHEGGSLLALAVGIRAGVEGVLEYRDDVAIAYRCPVKCHHLLAVGWARKVKVFSGE